MSGVNEIRTKFLDYFGSNGHEIVASSPLVPRNDPTLLFTNAGMVQFKNVFTGAEHRPYQRAVTSQKCVRAGGKHNDLENVGYTARHHTFFEMLGNFSFGDYFKERAIELAWNLVTKEFGLPADRLLTTVYAEDDEAFELWRKIAGLPEDRIIRIATDDNFWRMGDTGPCGPCSEIFYDHGDHIWGGPPGSPEEDGDRFIEIWNLVFMQYEQLPEKRLDLPRPSIDTGMGLERIATILQGVHDNYEIDLFRALIGATEDALGVRARNADGTLNPSFKVIADHLRALGFLMADGVLPSNEGRGYVLRRIMRRAMRHANMLGATKPVLHRLVPALVREMGQAYPELSRAEGLIVETTEAEEVRFGRTLTRGLSLLEEASAGLTEGASFSGETAFTLYDTYGFPYDLTEDALRPRGIKVDREGFESAMAEQKAKARANWAGSGDAADERVWFGVRDRVGATEFLGYDTTRADATVAAIVVDGAEVQTVGAGQEARIVFNQTPFYAESGGQVGDTGSATAGETRFAIADTTKVADGLFVHRGTLEAGTLTVGDALTLQVEDERRDMIRANHSATHILHECLRRVLGDHVAQKGSLVAPERLRFDFAQPKPITEEEIAAVERAANQRVRENDAVDTRVMGVDDAIESGARALFGEKYGDEVRVVSMGRDGNRRFSVELCGGIHVTRTGDIGLITIVEEAAVSSGVRRIEALTGETARRYLTGARDRLRSVAGAMRVAPDDAPARVEVLVEERRRLERELEEAKKKLALAGPAQAEAAREIAGVNFVGRVVDGLPGKALKGLADEARQAAGSAVVVIVGREEGRASVVVTISPDLAERFDAVELVRVGSAALGGKGGGGRRDMAQAGGPDADKADEAIAAIATAMEAAA
ncbi:alanine--tRNA ligase [Acuticoccus sediminis]|uniref:Alanine--tRNA ligase n=1 Tax=Acuticoccus sediminis TaxID=2184697 RepID=A0A8B2NXI2_9HYPH|nr:alanine--tRNA ligase [Acuticoccus sediminis]RAI04073.1 alanine--tRNA ligase [Acuticoccus sediminis]